MKHPDIQFTGVRSAQLDRYGMLSLGNGWPMEKGTTLYLTIVRPLIRVFTEATLAEMVQEVMDTTSLSPPAKRMLVGTLHDKIYAVKPDSRHRILIPLNLAIEIGLDKSDTSILVGRGAHFEIWEPEAYKQQLLNAPKD